MKFVYVMDEGSKKELLEKGFSLLKEDKENSVFVFENKVLEEEGSDGKVCFDLGVDVPHILSDVLTF